MIQTPQTNIDRSLKQHRDDGNSGVIKGCIGPLHRLGLELPMNPIHNAYVFAGILKHFHKESAVFCMEEGADETALIQGGIH